MIKTMPITEFMKLFPDDDACLEHLFRARFGVEYKCKRCGDIGLYKRLSKLPASHVLLMGNTQRFTRWSARPFYRSHTPLQKWFYAMYLFTTTRHGVPAKELQRQLSVNYKTAYRMGMQIRKYLAYVDADPPLAASRNRQTLVGGKHRAAVSRAATPSSKPSCTAWSSARRRDHPRHPQRRRKTLEATSSST